MITLDNYFQELTANKEPGNLYSPILYILSQGGKRLRPKLVFLSTSLFNGDVEKAIYPAAAFEMLHNFTLIHDDIMDNAPIRRGKPTVYKKWNNNIAILSGDALAIMALQQLLKTPCDAQIITKMCELFAKTSLEICEGQQYDLDFETMQKVSIEQYIEMIRLKTAVMLAGCLKAGAILADAAIEDQQLIYDFGIALGIAFQLKDDILDIYSDGTIFGKVKGGDIKENKKTFLYLTALNEADHGQKESLLHYFSSVNFDFDTKFEAVKEIYAQLHVKEKTESAIDQYVESAIQSLNMTSVDGEKKQELLNFAVGLSNRIK